MMIYLLIKKDQKRIKGKNKIKGNKEIRTKTDLLAQVTNKRIQRKTKIKMEVWILKT